MERHVDVELKKLKELLLAMGGFVEKAIEESTSALLERKPERFQKVYELEERINQSHIKVDEECVNLLATHSPLARDLRLVVSIIKINTDLERMGDQAVNISANGKRYLEQPPLKPLEDIPRMAQDVRVMVREALDAFVRQDPVMAREVPKRDDTVDGLKRTIFDELVQMMMKDPQAIERALTLILIARNLERLGDHATNIAEDVIFSSTGEDVRHASLRK